MFKMKLGGREGLLHLNDFKIMKSEKEHCSSGPSVEKFPPQQRPSASYRTAPLRPSANLKMQMTDPNSFSQSLTSDFFSSVSLITPDYSGVFNQRRWTCQDITHLFVGILIWMRACIMDGTPCHILSTVEKDWV